MLKKRIKIGLISVNLRTAQLEHQLGNIAGPFVVDDFEETGNVIVPQANVHTVNLFQFNISRFGL